MTLSAGRRLGSYEIVSLLGAGGMGEVYRALDPRLGRDVAVKVVAPSFLGDPSLAARFEREARLLGSLAHPNVAAVFGFESTESGAILVMELVEGETLDERLSGERLEMPEILSIARQIAEALEFAHEHGIVHRDLKPANVKLTGDGRIKVLDFGLAKMMDPGVASGPGASHSPTISLAATAQGAILGTAAYMSPEQAKGKTVDRRADIWAFGAILYEMLSGRRLFAGETVSDTLAAVLRQEIDWSPIRKDVPPPLRRLLRRCLERDPRQRLRDIGEARIAIGEAENPSMFGDFVPPPPPPPPAPAPSPVSRRAWIAPAIALGLLGAAAAVWIAARERKAPDAPVLRFSVPAPPGEAVDAGWHTNLAFSRDGRRIAFVAGKPGASRIYLRDLASGDLRAIPGTEGGTEPFFSPDGQSLGFISGGKLLRTSLPGAGLSEVTDVLDARGATWLENGTIVVAADSAQALFRVPASGGKVQALTRLDPRRRERTHRWPEALPGGKAVLFIAQTLDNPEFYDNATLEAVEIASGRVHRILEGASMARYLPERRAIVFARGSELFVQRFDPESLAVSGEPVSVLTGVLGEPTTGVSYFAVSGGGSLAYVTGKPRSAERRLVHILHDGKLEPMALPVRRYLDFSLSPDGRRLALTLVESSDSIWIYDLDRGTFGRVTSGHNDFQPIWVSNDEILFARVDSGPPQKFSFVRVPVAGGGEGRTVAVSADAIAPDGVTPDGKWALCDNGGLSGRADVVEIALDGSNAARPVAATDFDEGLAVLSPDGRWIAYQSNETGGYEIYVRPAPPASGRWQISSGGGVEPRWARDGRTLYFRCGLRLCSAAVTTLPAFSSERPRRVVEAEIFPPWGTYGLSYQPAADGTIYALLPRENASPVDAVNVVWDWSRELEKALAPR